MTYQETVAFLFEQLPMYQREGKAAYKADLANTWALMDAIGHPEKGFKSIHIAGTNGKGSTANFMASALQEAGYTVGLYTSPHLVDFRERVRINGEKVSEDYVVDFVARYKESVAEIHPSFFEWTVGLAFSYFSEMGVDVAVIEVGLGGRLDSTNVIQPLVSVITNIGLDHTQYLGDTLPKIAAEKAGIMKPHVPVVIGETQEAIVAVFEQTAAANHAPITFADQQPSFIDYSALVAYQQKNAQTVWVTLQVLAAQGFRVSSEAFLAGIHSVSKNTGFMGRWQVLQQGPKVVADTGHNVAGLTYTMAQLSKERYAQLRIVFGMVNDKSVAEVVALLPQDAHYYLCQPAIARALPVEELSTYFSSHQKKIFRSVPEALSAALADSQKDDFVYIGGSTFVVADIL